MHRLTSGRRSSSSRNSTPLPHIWASPAITCSGNPGAACSPRKLPSPHPLGLTSLLICNSPASMELWVQGAAELRAQPPDTFRNALSAHEAEGTLDEPAYLRATQAFYERHVCMVTPIPRDFVESTEQMEAEPTVYHTMNGPNEFYVVGSLRHWSIVDRLPRILVPTLV